MSNVVLNATVVASLGRTLGAIVLLAPLAVAAARSTPGSRDPALSAVTALGLAICSLVLGGLVLSSFSGVSQVGWLGALAVVDLLLLGRAVHRGKGATGFLRRPARERVRRPRPRALPTLLVAAALALVVVSVLFSTASARRQERQSEFTQLWMIPTARGGQSTADIGVRNLEGRTTSYMLVVAIADRVLSSTPLRLGSSRTWTTVVPLISAPQRQLLTAKLYRAGESSPYRTTDLWTPAS